VKTFEQSNGSITVVSAKGCVMVNEISGYSLALDGDAVKWEGSGDNTIDITDYLTNGKLGGWLDMRDEIIAKYKLDLDAVAEEFIWTVNQQHSQGVGLELFQPGSSVTGTYTTSTTLGDLNYGSAADYVDYTGTFKIWIGDNLGENLQEVTIDLDSGLGDILVTSSLATLRTSINDQLAPQLAALTLPAGAVQASISNNAIVFTAGANNTFGFANDTSNILAALGVNTFFDGTGSGSIDVNAVINDKDYIAAARIDASGNYATGDNTNALSMADLQYSSRTIKQWTCVRGQADTSEDVNSVTLEDYFHSMVSSIGVKSASISRGRAFNEVMFEKMTMVRDSISSVSLDEEMTNLIKYEQGYAAAAKLIGVADEMLTTLLSIK